MRLPKISSGRRGPKRLGKARKIASEGRKNWHARASMWLDGINGGRPHTNHRREDGSVEGFGNCYFCVQPRFC